MNPPSGANLPTAESERRPASFPVESVWSSRTQWGAILMGAFAGLAVVVIMATLGAALGITAGAISVSSTETMNADAAEKAATAASIGTAVWTLLTALVTGLVGGWVLNSTARHDRPYSSFIFGGVCWAVGVCLSLALASPSLGGTISGLGAGAGTTAGAMQSPGIPMPQMTPRTQRDQAPPGTEPRGNVQPQHEQRAMTDEEKLQAKEAAEKASAAATAAAWVILGSQLVSIAATMFAAGWNRHTGARVVTEIRPRSAPVT